MGETFRERIMWLGLGVALSCVIIAGFGTLLYKVLY